MSKDSQRKRRSFSDEFKRDAVNLIVKQNSSYAAAAKAIGVGEASLSYAAGQERAAAGNHLFDEPHGLLLR